MGFLDFIPLVGALASSVTNALSQNSAANKNYDAQIETNQNNLKMVEATNASNERNVNATNETNTRNVEATNKANRELWERQNEEQWRMWNAQNDYNSPAAQRERAKAAGLNPALAFGNGINLGTASSMTSPQSHPMQAAQDEPFQGQAPQGVAPHMDSVDYGQIGNAIASSASAFFDNALKQQEITANSIDLKFKEMDWKQKLAYMKAQVEESLGRKDKSLAETRKLQQDYRFIQASWDDMLQQQRYSWLTQQANIRVAEEQALTMSVNRDLASFQLQCEKQKLPLSLAQLRAGLKQIYSTIALQASQRGVNDAQVKKVTEETTKIWLESQGIKQANEQAKKLAPYIITQANRDDILSEQELQRETYQYDKTQHGVWKPLWNFLEYGNKRINPIRLFGK